MATASSSRHSTLWLIDEVGQVAARSRLPIQVVNSKHSRKSHTFWLPSSSISSESLRSPLPAWSITTASNLISQQQAVKQFKSNSHVLAAALVDELRKVAAAGEVHHDGQVVLCREDLQQLHDVGVPPHLHTTS